ncbi:hypothetical protein FW778_07540 [Ginsengibacter hankyongi]|uniref:SnoaL-like domain-containing protein n=1 Tax=Ginsengibacter hankyongi TaxID=2607284 RepID=A0A5J5ILI1_9BACT|nr:hypothetical protein [Ginsengibacter hankyongi]KAA9041859.1 hypothetical protein FW778_07540 [Ginsengibacter hankyongi]
MKKLFLFFLAGFAFSSCSNQGTESKEATKDSTTATTSTTVTNYPYTIDHPDNWDMGNTANTMIALSALKAFENGNVEESMKYFGDSIHIQFDGLDKTMPADNLKAMFTSWRNGYKSMEVKMDDWESVISKDKKDEWVTLWYRQKWEDAKGNKDSADYINDLKLKDGKIVRLDEYTRKLH